MAGLYLSSDQEIGYAEFETIILGVFEAFTPDAKSKLIARYRKLRREGLPTGSNKTKGSRASYSVSDLAEIIIAIQLYQFGIDSLIIIEIVRGVVCSSDNYASKKNAKALLSDLLTGKEKNYIQNQLFVFAPALLSRSWLNRPEKTFWKTGSKEAIFKEIEHYDATALINLSDIATKILAIYNKKPSALMVFLLLIDRSYVSPRFPTPRSAGLAGLHHLPPPSAADRRRTLEVTL